MKGWLWEASREKSLVRHLWGLLVRIIQREFEGGLVTEEVAWETMVFLLKGRGWYRGTGVDEVVWKVCTTVVNYRLNKNVTLHNALHGFGAGRGMGTATLESKLTQ